MYGSAQGSVVDKPDLATVLEFFGAQVKDRHGYVSMKCVIHEDSHASATVNIDKQRYHCFVCQFDGDVYDVVARIENIGEFKDAVARAEEITNGNRAKVSRSTGRGDSLLPQRSGNNKGSRRYIPPRYSA